MSYNKYGGSGVSKTRERGGGGSKWRPWLRNSRSETKKNFREGVGEGVKGLGFLPKSEIRRKFTRMDNYTLPRISGRDWGRE
jgi:hypothetical protein